MFCKKLKIEIQSLKNHVHDLELNLLEREENIEYLKSSLTDKETELDEVLTRLDKLQKYSSLLETQSARLKKSLADISSCVGDRNPNIIEIIGSCEPSLVSYNRLPVMTARIMATKVTIRPDRFFNDYCSTLSSHLDNNLSQIFINPTVNTTAVTHGFIINITSKYCGKFQDSCSALQRLLSSSGALSGIMIRKMDSVERNVEYVYHQPFRN